LGVKYKYWLKLERWCSKTLLDIKFLDEALGDKIPPPDDFVCGVYKEAGKHLESLFSGNAAAIADIKALTTRLSSIIRKTGLI
jgi:hypothetical protein